jgi:hypothetical protein
MAHDPCCCLDLELSEDALALDVADVALEWGSDEYVRVVNVTADEYDGPYDATPSNAAQTFATTGKLMTADFVVNPIPSNYGLVTWDGAVLTVS